MTLVFHFLHSRFKVNSRAVNYSLTFNTREAYTKMMIRSHCYEVWVMNSCLHASVKKPMVGTHQKVGNLRHDVNPVAWDDERNIILYIISLLFRSQIALFLSTKVPIIFLSCHFRITTMMVKEKNQDVPRQPKDTNSISGTLNDN